MASADTQRIERMNRLAGGLAVGLWLALAAVIAGKTLQNPENHSTYPIFRDASLAWWDGVNVYDSNVFGGDYRYGPSFAMVLGPIAWLPYRIGAVLWALMNVGRCLLGDQGPGTTSLAGHAVALGPEPVAGRFDISQCPLPVFEPDQLC